MPSQKSLLTVIQDIVRREIAATMATLLNVAAPSKRRTRLDCGPFLLDGYVATT